MSIRLTPGDGQEEWVSCEVAALGYYLDLYEGQHHTKPHFLLTDDEVLALSLLHPAVKRLIDWADSLVGVMNTRMGYADDWNEGREILRLLGRRKE